MKTGETGPTERLRRAALTVRLTIVLGLTVVAVLIALAVPALAATPGTSVATSSCTALAATGSDLSGQPSDGLDATRQCGGSPNGAQARYEAILAGVGVLGFAGATLLYRRRHLHPPASPA